METPGGASRGLWISLLAPLLFSSCAVVTGQLKVDVTQLPETVSVKAGENLTLKCTLTGGNIPGGVRWYKGPDRSQTPIYSDKQEASNRVVRVIPGSNTDFSIDIQNIRPEDAGTYYCVKFRAGIPEKELVSGKGTLVSVIAMPSQPVVLGPTRRITAGSRASFSCSTGGFSPREITVSWLKDGKKIPGGQTNILNSDEKQSISYRAENTLEIMLDRGDVKSQLTCQIQHRSLDGRGPLQQIFALRDVLRVPPKVRLETSPPSPVQLNVSVTVTCNAESFYPDDAKVELFPKDAPSRKGKVGAKTSNQDGTFSLKSNLEMMATEDKNFSMFLCQVQHDSQPLVNETTTLLIRMQPEDNRSMGDDKGNGRTTMIIIAVVVCSLLVVLVIAVIYLIQARHSKGKDSTSVRLHEAEKSPPMTNQDTDPNNVAYADLNFDKEAQKRPCPGVESPLQSEYATLQAVKPLPNDDNVTYADLDMVQLNKAPKRPAPKAEEVSSEYASVQVQNK
ncbi:tyrosine-protein phosphatase non-receptor type substrate 1 [Ahaetulla prasina]|uniref:tyrosine-protein phosphatase non-receptor type substrate 1 n=1 Tax=Ahaetulla prasina TaxID=499056 RepID=UPI002649B131|nr:tyrosine-protein phosphatase non-receptor type substrate 1 [Ahaetulla prasina]